MVPGKTQIKLLCGLMAPNINPIFFVAWDGISFSSHCWCAVKRMNNSFEMKIATTTSRARTDLSRDQRADHERQNYAQTDDHCVRRLGM